MTIIMDGTALAREIRTRVSQEAREESAKAGRAPGLAVILAGDNPASEVYVRMKRKACAEAGIESFPHRLKAGAAAGKLFALIEKLNRDHRVDGILLQLPLPEGFPEGEALEAIAPEKDVDGFHPLNAGRLLRGEDAFVPCTPGGIVELLRHYGIQTRGKHAVIIGRSLIVGKPLAALLLRKGPGGDATVTVCHSRTPDLAEHLRRADILIAALGRPRAVTADMVKEGAAVVDVGINETGRTPDGKRILEGDVDFVTVARKAAAITPVPGGVGPMTIAMLMKNTMRAFRRRQGDPRWAKP